jgi:glycosyltransferase involved in cell wall biosynthesis
VSPADVTVVIPTRNRRRHLADALSSALSQTGPTLEVVVVDEASTDGTREFLERVGDARVTVRRHSPPKGVAAARNAALENARTDWIAFLDDDDVWAPEWLHTALTAAQGRAAGLVYGSCLLIDEQRRGVGTYHAVPPDAAYAGLATDNVIGGPSVVVLRTETLRGAGGFDERLSALADWDAWLRLRRLTTFAAVEEPKVGYTVHGGNMHIARPFDVLAEFRRFRTLAAGRGDGNLDEVGFTRWLAQENAAFGHRLRAARLYIRSGRVSRSARDVRSAVRVLARASRSAPRASTGGPEWLAAFRDSPEPA